MHIITLRGALAFCSAALLLAASAATAEPPTVTGVTASQRGNGSKLVDIYYNLTDPDTSLLWVSVKISNDGGATWGIIPRTISGAVGANITPGAGKHIVWDAGADVPGVYGTAYRALITVSDSNMGYPGEMVYIPAGSFLMGSVAGSSNEMPQHEVSLSGFWIGRTEVTRGEYRQFMDAGGYDTPGYWTSAGWTWRTTNNRRQPSYWAAEQNWGTGTFTQTDQHPVVGVSYYEAEAFCRWAGGRLPTEAEWEKAARWEGHPREFPWGDEWHQANCNNWNDDNALGGGYQKQQTAPVSSYPWGASPYGLHDMAGNVWEWCKDWYSATYYTVSPSTDPQGPSSGSTRVLRGGSWNYGGDYGNFRCAYRYYTSPDSSYNNSGFRIAR